MFTEVNLAIPPDGTSEAKRILTEDIGGVNELLRKLAS